MWKGKPVIGGTTGGIPTQILHEVTGFAVSSVAGAAYFVRHLLSNPELIPRMGAAGRGEGRRDFFITPRPSDYLALPIHLTGRTVCAGRAGPRPPRPSPGRGGAPALDLSLCGGR